MKQCHLIWGAVLAIVLCLHTGKYFFSVYSVSYTLEKERSHYCQTGDRLMFLDDQICSNKYAKSQFIWLNIDGVSFDQIPQFLQYASNHSVQFKVYGPNVTRSSPGIWETYMTGMYSMNLEIDSTFQIRQDSIVEQIKLGGHQVIYNGIYDVVHQYNKNFYFNSDFTVQSQKAYFEMLCPQRGKNNFLMDFYSNYKPIDQLREQYGNSPYYPRQEVEDLFEKTIYSDFDLVSAFQQCFFNIKQISNQKALKLVHFSSNVDVINHSYGKSGVNGHFHMFRIQKILKAIYDVVIQNPDMTLIVLSDHGGQKIKGEDFLEIHGIQHPSNNLGVLFIAQSDINSSHKKQLNLIDHQDVVPTIAQTIQNVNIPLESKGIPQPIDESPFYQLLSKHKRFHQLRELAAALQNLTQTENLEILRYVPGVEQITADNYADASHLITSQQLLSKYDKKIKQMKAYIKSLKNKLQPNWDITVIYVLILITFAMFGYHVWTNAAIKNYLMSQNAVQKIELVLAICLLSSDLVQILIVGESSEILTGIVLVSCLIIYRIIQNKDQEIQNQAAATKLKIISKLEHADQENIPMTAIDGQDTNQQTEIFSTATHKESVRSKQRAGRARIWQIGALSVFALLALIMVCSQTFLKLFHAYNAVVYKLFRKREEVLEVIYLNYLMLVIEMLALVIRLKRTKKERIMKYISQIIIMCLMFRFDLVMHKDGDDKQSQDTKLRQLKLNSFIQIALAISILKYLYLSTTKIKPKGIQILDNQENGHSKSKTKKGNSTNDQPRLNNNQIKLLLSFILLLFYISDNVTRLFLVFMVIPSYFIINQLILGSKGLSRKAFYFAVFIATSQLLFRMVRQTYTQNFYLEIENKSLGINDNSVLRQNRNYFYVLSYINKFQTHWLVQIYLLGHIKFSFDYADPRCSKLRANKFAVIIALVSILRALVVELGFFLQVSFGESDNYLKLFFYQISQLGGALLLISYLLSLIRLLFWHLFDSAKNKLNQSKQEKKSYVYLKFYKINKCIQAVQNYLKANKTVRRFMCQAIDLSVAYIVYKIIAGGAKRC